MSTARSVKPHFVLGLWRRLNRKPGGAWAFSRLICAKAPYFGSIKPLFTVLEPGRCEVTAKKRRAEGQRDWTVSGLMRASKAAAS